MTLRQRDVVVRQIPEGTNGAQLRMFMRECEDSMSVDRPCLVLDCSKLVDVDRDAIRLLLNCLEHAIKRNGDVRLACLTSGARSTLQSFGVSSLFEIYGSTAEAINSFYSCPASLSPRDHLRGGSHQASEIQ
jgi:anti-sigma B factor antagonist